MPVFPVDDDWDTKWRVEVPNRDPLELAPDTKEDTVQFLEHEETVQFTKQENTDQATELEDTVQFLEQKNADQFMEHEETVQCSEQGDTVEITKQEDTIQFSEQEDADHITKQEDTVQFSEQDTAQVRPMSPPIDFIGFMEADWVRTSKPVPRGSELLVYYGDDSARELTVHSETSGEAVTPSPAGTSSSVTTDNIDIDCWSLYKSS
ncbi:hypothetical protein FJT64_011421 [Amphibalanus amphitrite]|uniref:Uncharacterized protein n=1 Tax=Amphibalanus amphitrite TaxID=1232801 RepID=A0A6A4V233_AMPAM|nr:hypothetical protein FJT64_011421 [Amphibalanus amphitrite]